MSSTEQPKRRGRPPSGGREAILEATLQLIRERGIANLTTRGVAARAGVSEASVFYHFKDRAGLMIAAFESGMKPLEFMAEPSHGPLSIEQVLEAAYESLESFFDDVLPILYAAQSDEELRPVVADYIETEDLGPHKGVAALGGYLRAQQAAGRLSADADPEAIALMVIDAAFGRSARRQLLMRDDERLPTSGEVLDQIRQLLS